MTTHTRTRSTASGAHALSLKVLRLTRPSLATQTPLPSTAFGNGLDIADDASLAYPGADQRSTFPLTPLLTLPEAFGAAYVGESFVCTVCANNEVQDGEGEDGRRVGVSGVKMTAELQTPGTPEGKAVELFGADGVVGEEGDGGVELGPGETIQRTLCHELKEEGQHVLAVTLTYTETLRSEEGASGGRARTFRKLYQFTAQPLVAVRSKVTERKKRGKEEGRSWVLEAQVENVGETSVVLERLWLNMREGLVGKGVDGDDDGGDKTVLKAQDVEQVMFVLREEKEAEDGVEGRVPLAQLNVEWRSALGEKGSLTTGWLASRAR
ncbi:hypothetical protein LTR09_008409 [Extremus antarcticus]|uniref:DUF974 domain-containing protein n=1 Tax=Extremus antarcticus TaxID=702011 RepID=A0AAJ0DHX0_9PEZI|nr:hypothetical protein LTR09_008409 [Extremus antarcticus]